MNIGQFVNLVKKMRTAQQNYFDTREKEWLQKSKAFEKAVDDAIAQREERKQNG